MSKTFTEAAQAVGYLTQSIRNEGKEGVDSFYLQNVSFELTKDASLTNLPLADEALADFEWSWNVALGENEYIPPNSYYRRRFGPDTKPYGVEWNLPFLFDQFNDPLEKRRIVVYNGQQACIMSFHFWVELNELEVTVSLRSSDVGEMLALDIQYTRHFQQKLCDLLGFTLGKAHYNINNAHILK
jgi:hypothetical protein